MNKKTIRIISTIITIAMILMFATSTVFAAKTPGELDNVKTNVDDGKIDEVGATIIGILKSVGMVISVVILIVLGIKYMMGSAEEKASYKKTMIPYLVGAVLIFGASSIADAVYNLAKGI